MLTAGHYHTLTVRRISDHGLYLGNEEGDEVLLPNRFVSLSDRIGDRKEVFVYHDSEDRLVATTERPLATVGQAAFLEAVDKTVHGAFFDWGIPAKHLFLPNRNQQGRIEIGKKYVVYVYSDNITGRAVATTYLKSFVDNAEPSVAPRDETDILVALESPIGFRVVVNDRHWGMIYRNQIFRPVHVGDRMKAYVTRITEDNRIDLSLQKQGYDDGYDDWEYHLFKVAYRTKVDHLNLSLFLGRHQLHNRGLDERNQGHVTVCRHGNSA